MYGETFYGRHTAQCAIVIPERCMQCKCIKFKFTRSGKCSVHSQHLFCVGVTICSIKHLTKLLTLGQHK